MEEVLTVHFLRNDHWWRDVEIWLYTHRLSIFIAPKYPTIHPTFLRLLNLNTQIHAYRLIYDFLLYRKIKFLINSTAFKIKYLGKISRFSFQNYLQSNKINKCLLFRALKRRGEKKKWKKSNLELLPLHINNKPLYYKFWYKVQEMYNDHFNKYALKS